MVNLLHHNKSLIISKPSKCVGMIVMDYNNYVKMISISGDKDKFIKLGLAKTWVDEINWVELSKVFTQFN